MMLYVTDEDPKDIRILYKLYVYYACSEENTMDNFKSSMDCLEAIGLLKNDKEILKEVTKARFNIAREEEFDLDRDAS